MKKAFWIGFSVLLGIFLLASISYFWLLWRAMKTHAAEDCVRMISQKVGELYKRNLNPTSAEIDEVIKTAIHGNPTANGSDPDRTTADPYGTPYTVGHQIEGRRHTVTTTSAGPDRQFDTTDDLRYDEIWEALIPDKR